MKLLWLGVVDCEAVVDALATFDTTVDVVAVDVRDEQDARDYEENEAYHSSSSIRSFMCAHVEATGSPYTSS